MATLSHARPWYGDRQHVNRPLLSVRTVIEKGNRVVFSPHESYIENEQIAAKIDLKELRGGVVPPR